MKMKAKYIDHLVEAIFRRQDRIPSPSGKDVTLDDHQTLAMLSAGEALQRGERKFSIVHPGGAGKTVLEAGLLGASKEAKAEAGGSIANTQDIILSVERSIIDNIRKHLEDLGLDVGVWSMGKRVLDRPVILASIQSLQMNGDDIKSIFPRGSLGMIIGDEADKLITEFRSKVIGELPGIVRAGLTATPRWPDGRVITDTWGEIAHEVKLKEGIEKGMLAPPAFYLFEANLDADKWSIMKSDYDQKALEAGMKAIEIEAAIPEIYRRLVPKERRKEFPTLIFVPGISVLEQVKNKLQSEFAPEGVTVSAWSGDISADTMSTEINDFESGKLDILVLCEMGGRGLNLPRARVMIDAFPTLSPNKLEQRQSRVLRKVRPGTASAKGGFKKDYAIIAQVVPKSNKFRPLTLLDILDCWPDYSPGRIVGVKGGGSHPENKDGNVGRPSQLEIDEITRAIRKKKIHTNISLIETADIAQELKLRSKLPKSNDQGFFEGDSKRYGTISAWAAELDLSYPTIERRLIVAGIEGTIGMDRNGHVLPKGFFAESDVYNSCSDLLQNLPVADENGFFTKNRTRYGSTGSWSLETSLGRDTLKNRFKKAGKTGISGFLAGGHLLVAGFYSRKDFKEVTADHDENKMPRANDDGFLIHRGQTHATCSRWCSIFKNEGMQIKQHILRKHLTKKSAQSVEALDSRNQVHTFYAEKDARAIAEEYQRTKRSINQNPLRIKKEKKTAMELKQYAGVADTDGFFTLNKLKYGTRKAWSRVLKIDKGIVGRAVKRAELVGVLGWSTTKATQFYSEPDIRAACGIRLEELDQATEEGFFMKDGKRYGTVAAWVKTGNVSVSYPTVKKTLKLLEKTPIRGIDAGGQIRDGFYCEEDINDVNDVTT